MTPFHLLMLPGTLCTAELFECVLPQLPIGVTLHAPALTRGASTAACARLILADAPPTFALGGFSQGAIVALEIMRQAPERVTRLALLAANPAPPTDAQRKMWDIMRREVQEQGFGTIIERYFQAVYPPARTPRMQRKLLEMAQSVGTRAFLRQLGMLETRSDSRPFLSAIACPTLVVAGAQDPITPVATHEVLAAAIPGAKLDVLDACGHYSPLEQPEAVAQCLSGWLA